MNVQENNAENKALMNFLLISCLDVSSCFLKGTWGIFMQRNEFLIVYSCRKCKNMCREKYPLETSSYEVWFSGHLQTVNSLKDKTKRENMYKRMI